MAGGRKDGKRKYAGRGKFHQAAMRSAFIRAFIGGPAGIRGNVTRAVMHAGMCSTLASAKRTGNSLMREPGIIAAIERKLLRADATTDRITEELARIAFSDIREVASWSNEKGVEFIDSSTLDDETAGAIAEVSQRSGRQGLERKVKMHGKIEALALLARIKGSLAPSRVEVTGEGGGAVQVSFYIPSNGREVVDIIDADPPAALSA